MPTYRYRISPLGTEQQEAMLGTTWHACLDCPPLEALRELHVSHWDFEGKPQLGLLIVAEDIALELSDIFAELFDARFPIQRMQPMCRYQGDDALAMSDNNSSAFNCRTKTGSTVALSVHATGRAIDLNPVQNPYETSQGQILPPEGASFSRLTSAPAYDHPGIIDDTGPVVRSFESRGWTWGGRWTQIKDWHHFEKPT